MSADFDDAYDFLFLLLSPNISAYFHRMNITRIVKMQFREDAVAAFLQLFGERNIHIRTFPGCQHLELWRDTANPCIFFTYSEWENEAALEAYRQSHFFDDTWQQTKQLFAAKPEAWTVLPHTLLP
jgi:quinol monooxygenase YgiN